MTSEARDAELDAWLRTADISIPVSRAAIARKTSRAGGSRSGQDACRAFAGRHDH